MGRRKIIYIKKYFKLLNNQGLKGRNILAQGEALCK